MSSPSASNDPLPTLHCAIQYHHLQQLDRKLLVTMQIAGHACSVLDVHSALENEHSGSPIGIAFRRKWNARKLGQLSDWRLFDLKLEDSPSSTGTAGATVDIAENLTPTTLSDVATGVWDGGASLQTAGGDVEFLPSIHARMKSPIKLKWSYTGHSARFIFTGSENDIVAAQKSLVLDAIQRNWSFQQFGPLSDYILKSFTFSAHALADGYVKRVSI